MQQGLGRNTANIKTDAAEHGIPFDQADLEPEVCCAKRCGISAGSRAEYRQIKSIKRLGNFFILVGFVALRACDHRRWFFWKQSKGCR